jgi:hypothetical protein
MLLNDYTLWADFTATTLNASIDFESVPLAVNRRRLNGSIRPMVLS